MFAEAVPSENNDENNEAVEGDSGGNDCIVDAVQVSGVPGCDSTDCQGP